MKNVGKSSGGPDDLDDTIIRNRFKVYLKKLLKWQVISKVNKVVELVGIGSIEDILWSFESRNQQHKWIFGIYPDLSGFKTSKVFLFLFSQLITRWKEANFI
ncbi:MAG: hypothetical protein IPF58_10410 [Saprospirales bacterium]|nr:hypothetical protein [Saprospirales bacterium]